MHVNPLAVLLLLGAPAVAQGVSSPKGFETTEGNTVFYHWNGTRRWMQIDNTHAGKVMVLKSISFRRDGSGGGTGAMARMFNASVEVGHASWGVVSIVFDDNYLPGTRTTVFTKKQVSMPDWTAAPSPAPAAFDFTIVYDTAWPYIGTLGAIVWDVAYDGGPTGQAVTDRHLVTAPPTAIDGAALGTGCVATGMTGAFEHALTLSNFGSGGGMALTGATTNAPAGASVSLLLDAVNANLSVPGLCTILYALPTIVLPLGAADATGTIVQRVVQVPYNAALQGGVFFTQCAALDPGKPFVPFALSNGRQTTMPAAPATSGIQCAYVWSVLPSTTGNLFYGGGMMVFLGT